MKALYDSRDMCILAYRSAGKTFKEISEILGISVERVKLLANRGRKSAIRNDNPVFKEILENISFVDNESVSYSRAKELFETLEYLGYGNETSLSPALDDVDAICATVSDRLSIMLNEIYEKVRGESDEA